MSALTLKNKHFLFTTEKKECSNAPWRLGVRMKLFAALLLTFLCPPHCPDLLAQARCPARTLDECPVTGCGGWDKELNARKNFTPDLRSVVPQATEEKLEGIKSLGYPEHWYYGRSRAELKALGEGRLVRLTAYLIQTEQEGPGPANCFLPAPENTSLRLSLVSEDALQTKPAQRLATSVSAEVTPRVGRGFKTWVMNRDGTGLRIKTRLDRLIEKAPNRALLVRVTGLLLLDTEHIYNPLPRYTDWEIHPALRIEVCRTPDRCAEDQGWEDLDEMPAVIQKKPTIKPKVPMRKGPRINTKIGRGTKP